MDSGPLVFVVMLFMLVVWSVGWAIHCWPPEAETMLVTGEVMVPGGTAQQVTLQVRYGWDKQGCIRVYSGYTVVPREEATTGGQP